MSILLHFQCAENRKQAGTRRRVVEFPCFVPYLGRHALRKGRFLNDVLSRRRVDFANGRQVRSGKLGSEANQCAPEMPVDKGYFAPHEPAYQNVRVIADRTAKLEDFVGTRMGPPIAADRRTRDRLGQTGDRPAGRLRNDAVLFNEVYGLFFRHVVKYRQRNVSGESRKMRPSGLSVNK